MESVVVIPFNKIEESERILSKHARDLACVIVDPMPNRVGLIPVTKEYLTMLRNFTRRHGVLLVLDEVISFRLGYHGAQGEFDFKAIQNLPRLFQQSCAIIYERGLARARSQIHQRAPHFGVKRTEGRFRQGDALPSESDGLIVQAEIEVKLE